MQERKFEIVGAALCRTGTLSLKRALDTLGYQTYHMEDVMEHPDDAKLWIGLNSGKMSGKQVTNVLVNRNFNASVDAPGALFWEQLYESNPHAKVILTLRNFDKWYESVSETIHTGLSQQPLFFKLLLKIPFGKFSQINKPRQMVAEIIFGPKGFYKGKFEDKEFVRNLFNQYIENVKQKVPKDQLLVYEITQGWEPLCKFLDKPIPNEPFPRVNDREAFQAKVKSRRDLFRQSLMGFLFVCFVLFIGIKIIYSNFR